MKIEDSDLNKKGDIFGIHKTNSVYREKNILKIALKQCSKTFLSLFQQTIYYSVCLHDSILFSFIVVIS